jgi:hypothetical protein
MSQNRRISITLPSQLVRRLEAVAAAEHISLSRAAEEAVETAFAVPDLDRVERSLARAQDDLDLLLSVADAMTDGAEPLLPVEGTPTNEVPEDLRKKLAERLRLVGRRRVGHG